MRHKLERTNKYRVKYVDVRPGDVLEDDGKFFIARSRRPSYDPCDGCAFSDKTGYCLVNINNGNGNKICQTDHGGLIFKGLISVLENL